MTTVADPARNSISAEPKAPTSRRTRFTAGEVTLYRLVDELSGVLVVAMVIFSPWAFGTTQRWSIWTMNIAGYTLGLGLAVKLVLRHLRGYPAPRWWVVTSASLDENEPGRPGGNRAALHLTRILAALTACLLGWCLVSALNARAVFDNYTLTFEYRDCIRWLPHSFDRDATWFAFWMYLGLAGAFWGLWDWLLGKTSTEVRSGTGSNRPFFSAATFGLRSDDGESSRELLPARLRLLMWVLAINGAVLGIEAIVQRAVNSPRLLFLVLPRIHQTADGQFGPYAYRSNAAQYFNLLWPVCLGFWWTLNRNAGIGRRRHHWLLAALAVIAAGPIISSSRAGAIITVLMVILGSLLLGLAHLFFSDRRSPQKRSRVGRALILSVGAALLLGFGLGWKSLGPRLAELPDGLAGREMLYHAARPMARDYPLFGTGPGSFETVSQLYPRPEVFWPSQLHNDWLETRITFGALGSGFISLAFGCVLGRWFTRGGIHGGRRLVMLCWLSLAGCLLHARYDFPFQIHSTLFLFLVLCGILFTLSRRGSAIGN